VLAKRPFLGRLTTAVAAAACLALATAVTPAAAKDPSDTQAYVKYYVVAAEHEGRPENLPEIALRFLGSGARSADIYNLNTGRVQPDGSSLNDPAKLQAGWYLILPWDAAGTGVKYGQIPAGAAPATTAPIRKPPAATRPATPGTPDGGAAPTSAAPTATKPATGATTATPGCTTVAVSSKDSDWARLRLAVDGAWDVSRGNGVMVAVVDSGVDGRTEQLNGRLAVGADVTVGNGRGDTDCLGTGTAMAGIIAAGAGAAKTPVGVAPDATILPVRMVSTTPAGRPADAANAIEVAVSAGASVVALGGYVDLSAPEVTTSLTTALNHDVLVIAPAPTKAVKLPVASEASATGALLLVGGVDAGNKLIEGYQPDTVEVVAPGADVTSIGPGSSGTLTFTGTPYAVAAVAGTAALVRAAYPELSATQVEQRIAGTADGAGNTVAGQGAGMINPGAAVTRVDDRAQAATAGPAGAGAAAGAAGGDGGRGIAAYFCLGVVLIAGGIAVVVWIRRRRG
jgi:membrane-anchored mycosin MYCP